MCGGKGERIKDFCSDKTMLEFNNKPFIEHILLSLRNSKQFDKIIAAASSNNYYHKGFLEVLETSGIDYSTDLMSALEKLVPALVFVMPSDMPLITPDLIRKIISSWNGNKHSISVVMDKEFIVKLGLLPTILIKLGNKEYFHSGITIFNSSKIRAGQIVKEDYIALNDENLAFNINTKKDFFLLKSKLNQGY
jgi:GTP:adenosylcobinamide-phosphate guanylyltransferase